MKKCRKARNKNTAVNVRVVIFHSDIFITYPNLSLLMERLYSVLLSILICTMSLAGCLGSNDSENSDDDNDSDSIGNNETTILFEGDQPGECEDGADNDRDGLFDCDDPNCAGSAVCKVNEENNTNQNDNGSTEDVYSEFDDHKIVNLTNGIISSGYFDEAIL